MQKNPSDHNDIDFNSMPFKRNTQKHLRLHFNAHLNFSEHIKGKKSSQRYQSY